MILSEIYIIRNHNEGLLKEIICNLLLTLDFYVTPDYKINRLLWGYPSIQ